MSDTTPATSTSTVFETNIGGEVLVIAELTPDNHIAPVTLELLGIGRELADKLGNPLTCMVMGQHVSDAVQAAIAHGADTVYVADHPQLATYTTLPYKRVACQQIEQLPIPPHIILQGSTTQGRDLAPRIAAYFKTGLTADVIEMDIGPYDHTSMLDPAKVGLYNGCLYAVRPSFGESLKARILGPWNNPQMATARPGVFAPLKDDPNRQAKVITMATDFTPEDLRIRVLEVVTEVTQGIDITEADVIVAGGFGLGGPEGFVMLQELADCFNNAVLGASRKAVDLGWMPYKYQVGQTGKTVRPKLYIACGIAGAIQHRVGMSKSDTIIAINKNPDAPIFKFATHGIVGDIYHVVPEMIKQLKAQRQQGAAVASPVVSV
jgi:electron transfer flavoprotein alpha subunit